MDDSNQDRIHKKFELLNMLRSLPRDCASQKCNEIKKEVQNLFNSNEIETISKKFNIKFSQI